MQYNLKQKKIRIIKSNICRKLYSKCELDLKVYKYLKKNKFTTRRIILWNQEYLVNMQLFYNDFIIQNLCIMSGRKRSLLQFFQLYRLELRDKIIKTEVPNIYYLY